MKLQQRPSIGKKSLESTAIKYRILLRKGYGRHWRQATTAPTGTSMLRDGTYTIQLNAFTMFWHQVATVDLTLRRHRQGSWQHWSSLMSTTLPCRAPSLNGGTGLQQLSLQPESQKRSKFKWTTMLKQKLAASLRESDHSLLRTPIQHQLPCGFDSKLKKLMFAKTKNLLSILLIFLLRFRCLSLMLRQSFPVNYQPTITLASSSMKFSQLQVLVEQQFQPMNLVSQSLPQIKLVTRCLSLQPSFTMTEQQRRSELEQWNAISCFRTSKPLSKARPSTWFMTSDS